MPVGEAVVSYSCEVFQWLNHRDLSILWCIGREPTAVANLALDVWPQNGLRAGKSGTGQPCWGRFLLLDA